MSAGARRAEEPDEDVKPKRRCEEKREAVKDKPWRNEELRSLSEDLPQLKEERLERGVRRYHAGQNDYQPVFLQIFCPGSGNRPEGFQIF